MTDTLYLKSMLVRRGITLEEISSQIGLSKTSLSYKINNKRQFTATEIAKLSNILGLSANERDEIFFGINVELESTN